MTYEDLVRVNKTINKTDIKGKEYAEVNERIKAFRQLYPEGTIATEIISVENGVVIIKATVMNGEGAILGTGHAYEKEGSTFINKTSYIENAETSAVGRALGMLGIGIDTAVASYEEVANAIKQQEEDKPKAEPKKAKKEEDKPKKVLTEEDMKARNDFLAFCSKYGLDSIKVCERFKLNNDSRPEDFYNAIEEMKGKGV